MLSGFSRIAIVGNSCSGKTTLAARIAQLLGLPHLELDSIYWGPNWRPRPEFVDRVRLAVAGDRWIIDGNFGMVRPYVWARAEAVVWLNLPLHIVLRRAMHRTAQRIRAKEIVYGNRETLWRAPWSIVRSHRRRVRKFRRIARRRTYPQLTIFELRSPDEVSAFVEEIAGAASLP